MDKNIYMLITEKQLLVNSKRVEHGLLLERGRPLAQDLLLLLSLVSSQMICKMAVVYSKLVRKVSKETIMCSNQPIKDY